MFANKIRSMFILIGLPIIAIVGCSPGHADSHVSKDGLTLLSPTPIEAKGDIVGRPTLLSFGGIYEINSVSRTGKAESVSAKKNRTDLVYEDGAISICIHAVPYGVRLKIENHRPQPILIQGSSCSMIDAKHRIWRAELREPGDLFPLTVPMSQEYNIPEGAECEIDLDVISPRFRDRINRIAKFDEERGAFIAIDAPLPVFCSGFYVYPSAWEGIQTIRTWALQREFGIHIEFRDSGGTYGYTFNASPIQFNTGPGANDEARCIFIPTPSSFERR